MDKLNELFKYIILILVLVISIFVFYHKVNEEINRGEKNDNNSNFKTSPKTSKDDVFQTEKIKLNAAVDLFDIGLAKINSDHDYDIFTANHNFAESFFIYRKNNFVLNNSYFNSYFTGGFPKLESTGETPKFYKPGLYIFSPRNKIIILFCKRCTKNVIGQIKIPVPDIEDKGVIVEYKKNAEYKINSEHLINGFLTLDIQMESNSIFVIESKYLSIVNELKFNLPADNIFVGPEMESPHSSNFTYGHSDNHSMAFSQIDNSKRSSLFAGTGGLRSHLKYFNPDLVSSDKLLYFNEDSNSYVNKAHESGIKKADCRTYKAEWIDINADGYLDLYLGCANSPNQLYVRNTSDNLFFHESAKSKGLDIFQGDEFKWQDWNDDGYPDLLVIEKNRLSLYINESGKRFQRVKQSKVLGSNVKAVNSSIKVQDINNNGILDIFVSTSKQIFYFIQNGDDDFRMKNIKTLKLPKNINGHFNFVDVNLDGLTDIVFFDYGIYLQTKNNKFKKSKRFKKLFNQNNPHHKYKNFIWFDINQDGLWDIIDASAAPRISRPYPKRNRSNILGYNYYDKSLRVSLRLHKNISFNNGNKWLQIDLNGAYPNKDAIGAKVIVKTNEHTQIKYNHGSHDSFHSQGHYRSYFGLGNPDWIQVEVIWPDQSKTLYKEVKPNQLFVISEE